MKTLRLRGFRLESLLNRALAQGLQFRLVRRTAPREMQVLAPAAHAARLEILARERGIGCEETGSTGADRLFLLLRRRCTLAAGFLLMAAILYFFSGRIWLVDVQAETGALDPEVQAQVYSILQDLDVRPGVRPPDPLTLTGALSARCPALSHVGVRITGVRLLVSGVQADPLPDLYQPLAARDLVADRDGVVLEVRALAGQAAVQPGDTVQKGDVLILGTERISDEETRGIQALGQVTARVWNEAALSAPIIVEETRLTGRSATQTTLIAPGLRIPLTDAPDYAAARSERTQIRVVGMFLPVYVEKIVWQETETVTRTRDGDALLAELRKQAVSQASAAAEGEILRIWTREENNGQTVRVHAIAESAAQIAVSR